MKFPADEAAPRLGTYLDFPPPIVEHVSVLERDPDARMDLLVWARLHYQILHVADDALTSTMPKATDTPTIGLIRNFLKPVGYADVGDTFIRTFFPHRLLSDKQVEIKQSVNEALSESGLPSAPIEAFDKNMGMELTTYFDDPSVGSAAMFFSAVKLDLERPGIVTVSEALVVEEGSEFALSMATRFTPADQPKITHRVERPLDHVPEDDTAVVLRQARYGVGDAGGNEMIELLRAAGPSDLDETDARQEVFIDKFSSAMAEFYYATEDFLE